jgi:hypothetical protein
VRDGRPIAVTGGADAVVRLWDADGTCLRTLDMPARVHTVVSAFDFHRVKNYLASPHVARALQRPAA